MAPTDPVLLRGRGLTSRGTQPDAGVAVRISNLARLIEAEPGVLGTLDAITAAAIINIPGAQHAGITVVNGLAMSTPAASDDLARGIDAVQYEVNQGPCLSAIREQATVRSDDLAIDTRWPLFAARAVDLGIRSMLAFQLFVRDRELGALNLYSSEVNAFGDEAENIGLLLAAHAAIAFVGAQRQQDLQDAVSTRDIIGQAKGILMERHKITSTAAFERLLRASSRTNLKLAELAQTLATTGSEP